MELISKNRLKEIKEDISNHNQAIITAARKTVEEAIIIGSLLSEAKELVGHGGFIEWVEKETKVENRTAQRYMQLFEYKDKCDKLSYLDEAYKMIENIRAKEKKEKEQQNLKLIKEKVRTGKDPEGWNVSLEKEYKKHYDDKERDERIKKLDEEIKNKKQEKEREKFNFDNIKQIADQAFEKIKKMEDLKQSMSGNEDIIFMIDGYLEKLPNNSRRHEFCNTLIKHLRTKSIEYSKSK